MRQALKTHWPEYLIEAAGLALFLASACAFATLLFHPASPVAQQIESPLVRRMLMGLAMGGTGIALVYSPWGRRSGAHFNPSLTLTFYRLGRVAPWDAALYALAQFAGGLAGMLLLAAMFGDVLADAAVNYVATQPGPAGVGAAFLTETAISFLLMSVVLCVSNTRRLARFTGVCAGVVVAANITLAAPLSGMSMNPARTLASAVPAHVWTAIWVYFTAPLAGMLLAAQVYVWMRRRAPVFCAKLQHDSGTRCIFCEFHATYRISSRGT